MSKCSWISFHWNKSLKYILFYWLLESAFRLFMYIRWDLYQLTENDADNEYLYIISLVLSDYLSYIFLLPCLESVDFNPPISRKNSEQEKLKLLKIVGFFGLPVFDFVSRSWFFLSYKLAITENAEVSQKLARDSIILIDTVFRIFFYIFFNRKDPNKQKAYSENHKLCSIIFILIIFGLLLILDVIHMVVVEDFDALNCVRYFGFLLPRSIIYPFIDTIVEKFMYEFSVSPTGYMRRRSITESILLVIITTILLSTSNLHISSDIFNFKFFFIMIIYFIISFFKSFLLANVIYYFTAQSVSFLIISESLAGSMHEIYNFVNKKEKMTDVVNIIISLIEIVLIILICLITLIFEEIIEIKIYGLNEEFVIKQLNDKKAEDENEENNKENDPLGYTYDKLSVTKV